MISPGPFHPWVWHQSPHMFHTELVSSTNPNKDEKDKFNRDNRDQLIFNLLYE